MAKKNTIDGDIRRFIIINTTEYNEDGKYGVIDCGYYELDDYGVHRTDTVIRVSDKSKIYPEELYVGDIATTDFVGAYIMRVA